MSKPQLLLATNNRGKVREYRALLRGIPFKLVAPADIRIDTVVEETGATFKENARLKATTLAKESGFLTLADDSGLEVDALGGAPGARSHRFAGDNATDDDRVNFLLSKLEGVPEGKRGARFVCVIAIASPDGKVQTFSGECKGVIASAPRGNNGFGYDPVFYLPELGRTMAELSFAEKNKISHRARAAAKAKEALERLTSH